MNNMKKTMRDNHFSGFLSHLILLFLVILLSTNRSFCKNSVSKGIETVVIDAGHGGKDPGAIVGNIREKDIVLDIALRLGSYIRENLPKVKVIYTRSSDVFVPLLDRSIIANKNNADLFISIHANMCGSPSVKGTETYVLGLHRTEDNLNVAKKENSVILLEKDYSTRYEGFNPKLSESYIMFELIQNTHLDQSVLFAGILQENFQQHAQRANRDVRQAGFLVLRETSMPGVLVETGYLSNKSEASYLMTADGRKTIALSMYKSFKIYKEKYESRVNITSNKQNQNLEESKTDSSPKKDLSVQKKEPKENGEKIKSNIPITTNTEITFAIQLLASPVKISHTSTRFKGIRNIEEFNRDGYYKYYCLETDTFKEAKQNLVAIRSIIPDAFIIAFKNGNPISITEALKTK